MSGQAEEYKAGGDRISPPFQAEELARLEVPMACSFVSLIFLHLPQYLTLSLYY